MHVAAHAGNGDWVVKYPTLSREEGKDLRLNGDLAIVCVADACSPAITSGDEVAILDPRAIISDAESGQIFYGPSSIPLDQHSDEMADWIKTNPDWEREYAPNGVPTIELQLPGGAPPSVFIDENTYTAPRVGTRPQSGREIRRATCGHDVYLSEQGVDAVERRGKKLVCGPCLEALASERGMAFSVTDKQL